MNYLAHIYLSGNSLEVQLGGLLGDFLKGPLPIDWLDSDSSAALVAAQTAALQAFALPQKPSSILLDSTGRPWPRELLAGVYLHRSIDAYIDRQPLFKACVERLGAEHRRIAGIALDVFFDHLLASHWDDYHRRPLAHFCDDFYQHCSAPPGRLPARAEQLMRRAQQHKLLESYADLEVIEVVLARIDQRMRRPTSLTQVMPVLRRERGFLQECFTELMPNLAAFAAQQRQRLAI